MPDTFGIHEITSMHSAGGTRRTNSPLTVGTGRMENKTIPHDVRPGVNSRSQQRPVYRSILTGWCIWRACVEPMLYWAGPRLEVKWRGWGWKGGGWRRVAHLYTIIHSCPASTWANLYSSQWCMYFILKCERWKCDLSPPPHFLAGRRQWRMKTDVRWSLALRWTCT